MTTLKTLPLLLLLAGLSCARLDASPPMGARLQVDISDRQLESPRLSLFAGGDECPAVDELPVLNDVKLALEDRGGLTPSSSYGVPTARCQPPVWVSEVGKTTSLEAGEPLTLTFDASGAEMVTESVPVEFSGLTLVTPAQVRVGMPVILKMPAQTLPYELTDAPSGEVSFNGELTPEQYGELGLETSNDELRVSTPGLVGKYTILYEWKFYVPMTRCEGFANCEAFVRMISSIEFEVVP